MGIPKYFRWLTNKYTDLIIDKNIVTDLLDDSYRDRLVEIKNINNLFLDANCLIHPCVRKILVDKSELISDHFNDYKLNKNDVNNNLHTYSRLEKCMFESVVNYIVHLVQFVKPKDILYISIDGVAPRAKMEQQRKRRYRSYKEKKLKDDIYLKHNQTQPLYWDTNAITPGTLFMSKLSHFLKKNLASLKNTNHIKVILSDSSIPGEGEHKIMAYLRTDSEDNINCIYGLDADLIMLALCSNKKIFLLREGVYFGKINFQELLFFSIENLKMKLYKEIKIYIDEDTFEISNNIVIDYVFLCFLLGNDFIPHLVNLDIIKNSINDLIIVYTKLLSIRKNYLVNDHKINYNFLQQILNHLYNNEDTNLKKIQLNIDKKRIYKKHYSSKLEKELNMMNNYPLLYKNNNVKLGSKHWRDNYYYHYFNIKNVTKSKTCIEKICKTYIEGLQWNIEYYLSGCKSWSWYYPYNAAPCLREICQYLNQRIYNVDFGSTTPLNPLEQLTMVIPRYSFHLLPLNYKHMLTDKETYLYRYYPLDFELDTLNNFWFHECDPKIPLLDDTFIISNIRTLPLNKIEQIRNTNTTKPIIISNK